MALADSVQKYGTQLLSFIDPEGKIIGTTEQVTPLLETLNTLTGQNFGQDIEGRLTINGISCTSQEDVTDYLTQGVEDVTYSSYFSGGGSSYYGTVGASGGKELAIAIAAACGNADYDYSEDPVLHRHVIKLSAPSADVRVLSIEVREYDPTQTPIQFPNIAVAFGSGHVVDIFNDSFILEEHSTAIVLNYEVYKGHSGDAMVKGCLAAEAYPEGSEIDFFKLVSPAHYTTYVGKSYIPHQEDLWDDLGYVQPDTNWDNGMHCGGIGIVQMTKGSSSSDVWGIVFMSDNELPLYVGMTSSASEVEGVIDDRSYRFCLPETRHKARTDDVDSVVLGPIFSPSTGRYVSRKSKFSICDTSDGSYFLTVGTSSYRIDHGLCID